MELTPEQIMTHALQLPAEHRAAIAAALQVSLAGGEMEHGPKEPTADVEAAWDSEISSRVDDIESGNVKTIPSAEAWKMIDGGNSVST